MRIKTILPMCMTCLLLRTTSARAAHAAASAILLLAAVCAVTPSSAQYGTPEHLRRMAPTIQDRDPGQAGDEGEMDAAYRRQPVFYRTEEKPGTIIIDTSDRFLYLIQGNN